MTNHSSIFDKMLYKRTVLICKLSQKNAEHLRLLQLINGAELLLMKDPNSTDEVHVKSDATSKIVNCLAYIAELETEVAEHDKQIEIILNQGT